MQTRECADCQAILTSGLTLLSQEVQLLQHSPPAKLVATTRAQLLVLNVVLLSNSKNKLIFKLAALDQSEAAIAC